MNPIQNFINQIAGMYKTSQQPGNGFGDFLNTLPGYQGLQNVRTGINNAGLSLVNKEAKVMGGKSVTPQDYAKMQDNIGLVAGAMGTDVAAAPTTMEEAGIAAGRPAPQVNPAVQASMQAYEKNPSFGLPDTLPAKPHPLPETPAPAPAELGGLPPTMGARPGVSQSLPTKLANKISPNISKVTSSSPGELGATARNATIQDTYRRWNAHDPASQDAAAQQIYNDVVNPGMAKNPKQVPLDNVVNQVVQEMRKLHPGLDVNEAKNAAHSVITDLYNQGAQTTKSIVPTDIPTSNLLDMRTALNGTTPVKNFFNGVTPQSAQDLATVAGRNAFSKIIETEHPDISQAIKDYGNLREGAPSMFKAANSETGVGLNPKTWGRGLPNLAEATLRGDSRVLAPASAALAGGGLYAFQNHLPQQIADTFLNQNSSQASGGGGQINGNEQNQNAIPGGTKHDDTLIPQSIQEIQPDASGKYYINNPDNIKGADGQSAAISDSQYKDQQKQLLDAQAQAQTAYQYTGTPESFQALQRANNALTSLETKHNVSEKIRTDYTNMNTAEGYFSDIDNILQDPKAAPSLAKIFGVAGISLDRLAQSTDPSYRRFATALQNLETQTGFKSGLLFQPGMTLQSAKAAIDEANKQLQFGYFQNLKKFVGSSPAPSQAPQQSSGLPPAGDNGLPMGALAPVPQSAKLNTPFQPTGQGFEGGVQ